MHTVAIAWLYVVVMMSLAEALSSKGSVLGALITFFLYGVLPLSIVLYLMGTPLRWRARRRLAQQAQASPADPAPTPLGPGAPDGGGEAPGDAVASMREKP